MRKTKDTKYLNISIDAQIAEQLESFSRKYGFTKTRATEQALKFYMNLYEKNMEKMYDSIPSLMVN
jgi:hypothetical protein